MFEIFENIKYEVINKGKDFVINDIHYDSRKIKENDVFCALIGAVTDGHNYIEKAVNSGAKMILVESRGIEVINTDVTYIFIDNLR